MSKQNFFHECEIKYQLQDDNERQMYERRAQELGFIFQGKQIETDFLPDTNDFLCRKHGLLLRFRRIVAPNESDILLTLKIKGTATTFQENFELEYRFSRINIAVFEHINQVLQSATGKTLPMAIHDYAAADFDQLIAKVKTTFPAHRILLEKKRTTYAREYERILFDTLPEGIGDYLEIEAQSPEKLKVIAAALTLDATHIELLDYGDILKRHKQGKPDQEARTGLFSNDNDERQR